MVSFPIICSSLAICICNFFISWLLLFLPSWPSKYCLFQRLIRPGEMLCSLPRLMAVCPFRRAWTNSSFCSLVYCLFFIPITTLLLFLFSWLFHYTGSLIFLEMCPVVGVQSSRKIQPNLIKRIPP